MVGARLQSNLVYGLKGESLGPGTKLAGLLAFGTTMSKVALNRKLASSQLEHPPSRWRGKRPLTFVKAVRPFTSIG